MKSANAIDFCQTSSFSKLNIVYLQKSLNSQQTTLNFICSFSALDERFRNEAVRDAAWATRFGRSRPETPMQTLRRDFRRRATLRRRAFGVPRENVRRMIRRAPAHRRTSARQTQENQPRVRHVRVID